jgi:hypothetical protein
LTSAQQSLADARSALRSVDWDFRFAVDDPDTVTADKQAAEGRVRDARAEVKEAKAAIKALRSELGPDAMVCEPDDGHLSPEGLPTSPS